MKKITKLCKIWSNQIQRRVVPNDGEYQQSTTTTVPEQFQRPWYNIWWQNNLRSNGVSSEWGMATGRRHLRQRWSGGEVMAVSVSGKEGHWMACQINRIYSFQTKNNDKHLDDFIVQKGDHLRQQQDGNKVCDPRGSINNPSSQGGKRRIMCYVNMHI